MTVFRNHCESSRILVKSQIFESLEGDYFPPSIEAIGRIKFKEEKTFATRSTLWIVAKRNEWVLSSRFSSNDPWLPRL